MTTAAPLTLPSPAEAVSWLDARCEEHLSSARRLADALHHDPPTDAPTALERWNDIEIALSNVASVSSFLSETHPLEEVRSRADVALQDVQALSTEFAQDPSLYAVFAGLAVEGLDEQAARVLAHTLRDFRRAGVDRDEPTRVRLKELIDRQVVLGQEFSKNIRDDVRSISVRPEQLDGLPADWIEAHPPGPDGMVTVTTDYPDSVPFRTFAHDRAAREMLAMAFLNQGWPANDAVLQELFALRREHAGLLGFATWADYDADVKMIGSGAAIGEFIDKIAQAAAAPSARDTDLVLSRLRQDHPEVTELTSVDSIYYSEVIRREHYRVDAQEVRRYFSFPAVRAGLLEVTGRLFGLTWTPAEDAVLWHDDVVAYDVAYRDGSGERIGRIYLDLHPREGKYKHAAQFTLARGVASRQLPEGVLVCNFSRGLMEHDEVVTLFHEFGHLIHHIVAGDQRWLRFSGVATEWDFVEAPSQMLEEWAWDAQVLATFALNADGEPIPAELVAAMRRAEDFGKGMTARTQMFYAALSYDFHIAAHDDLTARLAQLQARYAPTAYLPGTHMHCAFGHLEGYSSAYYTYMWSLVIAKDLFSAFRHEDLFDPAVAGRYRDKVLAPGGSKDAADLVADFLGRHYTFDAYARWLGE